ncbi:MAG TPA: TonB-dependent receptor, partial [Myxococcaceae bacterium]|nr:TonB-dependent receptor [Myxococcaceae bacterium]
MNNPAYGILGSRTPIEFIDQVNVITGGFLPEYGRSTAGTVTALTKSGGNEFHGSIYANLSPGAFNGTARIPLDQASSVQTSITPHNIGDYGATLGGPILKDKLWFFAGIQPSFSRYKVDRIINRFDLDVEGNPVETSPGVFSTQELARDSRFADQRSVDYIGNLTYLISDDHRLKVSLRGSPSSSGDEDSYNFGNAGEPGNEPTLFAQSNPGLGSFSATSARAKDNSTDLTATLNSSFLDKKLLVDTTLGWHNQYNSYLPVDGSRIGSGEGLSAAPQVFFSSNAPPHSLGEFETFPGSELCTPYSCPAAGYVAGGTGLMRELRFNAFQGRVNATYLANLLGRHVLKAGFDGLVSQYDHLKAYSGGAILQEFEPGLFVDVRNFGYLSGPDAIQSLTSIRTKSSAINLGGFVQDSWTILDTVTANVGVRYDSQLLQGQDGRNGLALPNQWSPRLGLVYDFTRQGRSRMFANYARYYENVPLNIADRSLSPEPKVAAFHGNTPDAACDANTPGGCYRPENRFPVNPANPNQVYVNAGGADLIAVDENIKAPSTSEVVAGFDYEVLANTRASIVYTRRYLNNWIEDMSRDNTATYFLGNPGRGIASDFPKAVRNYSAVTLGLTRSFTNLWLAQASYTWSRLRGNLDGLYRPEDDQLDPNANATFDIESFLTNQGGPLTGDRTHQIKIFAAREIPVTGITSFN